MITQIATTIEQSKRLIEAGLDPESADMWIVTVQPQKQEGWALVPDGEPCEVLSPHEGKPIGLANFKDTPVWSLSRLIDINGGYNAGLVYDSKCFIEALVQSICFLIPCGDIDEKFLKK